MVWQVLLAAFQSAFGIFFTDLMLPSVDGWFSLGFFVSFIWVASMIFAAIFKNYRSIPPRRDSMTSSFSVSFSKSEDGAVTRHVRRIRRG